MKEVDALVKLQAAEDAHDQEASKGKTGINNYLSKNI
jgi:hypothetical protein